MSYNSHLHDTNNLNEYGGSGKSDKSDKSSRSSKSSKSSRNKKNKKHNNRNINKKDRANEIFKFFKNTYRMYMIADATDDGLKANYQNRQEALGIKSKNVKPHITMMHIHVNADNPDHLHLLTKAGNINPIFKKLMEKKYYHMAPSVYLRSTNSSYDIMGEFFAKVYLHDGEKKQITDFRMILYLYLQMFLGEFKREYHDIDGRVFHVYSYNGRELLAVPEYYHGVGVWTPHVSIAKLSKIKRKNPDLYDKLESNKFDSQILIDELKGVRGSMNYLNLGMHFNKLSLSAKKI